MEIRKIDKNEVEGVRMIENRIFANNTFCPQIIRFCAGEGCVCFIPCKIKTYKGEKQRIFKPYCNHVLHRPAIEVECNNHFERSN